jgi:DNA-binding HxlR family transcriptional regulator
MAGYGTFCPLAKASEILAERWTLLIIRDLLQGSRHFNELTRGIPQISPTLLSKRLQTLEAAGLIERRPLKKGQWEYLPTTACDELRPILRSIGAWGQRWVRSKLDRDDIDVGALMWYIHRHFDSAELPPRRIVLYIEVSDLRRRKHWWMVVENGQVDLCPDDPGYEVDITLYSGLKTLAQIYIGDVSLTQACASGKVELHGARELIRDMPRWFARSRFADINPLPAG